MMEEQTPDLQDFWDNLLSGQVDLVREAFRNLDPSEREAVLAHLRRMATETGWQREQAASAEAALRALENWELNNEDR